MAYKNKQDAVKWYQNHKENEIRKAKLRNKIRHVKYTAIISKYKTIKGCCICGYNKSSAALDLHHREPKNKLSTIATMLRNYSWSKVKKEIFKCDVICANCHRELHEQERSLKVKQQTPNLLVEGSSPSGPANTVTCAIFEKGLE